MTIRNIWDKIATSVNEFFNRIQDGTNLLDYPLGDTFIALITIMAVALFVWSCIKELCKGAASTTKDILECIKNIPKNTIDCISYLRDKKLSKSFDSFCDLIAGIFLISITIFAIIFILRLL